MTDSDDVKADAFKLLAENARLKKQVQSYIDHFQHYHVAGTVDIDACAQCGLNFRDEVHTRWRT